MTVRFDDSLPALTRVLSEKLGREALASGVVVRDVSGRLAFFSSTELNDLTKIDLEVALKEALGPYARTDRVIASSADFGVATILGNPSKAPIRVNGNMVQLIDNRLAGADWLRVPSAASSAPPRFVFASLKGGVGRSTALSIAAADFAAKGRRVLAIDLDMESAGLGAMLLDEGTLPKFGMIDALVEDGVSGLDETFYADLVGPSALADRNGRIDVIPAIGRSSIEYPGDVLAKLARAYTEDVKADGSVSTILDSVSAIVAHFSDTTRYDVILVDARAGLHETTASAILGLGAEVLLFGLNEEQTFQGYAALFSHLMRFRSPSNPVPEWLNRLTMVYAKADENAAIRRGFADKCRVLFDRVGITKLGLEPGEVRVPEGSFKDVPWDDALADEEVLISEELPLLDPLAILDNPRFRLFEPLRNSDLLTREVYRASFGTFLDRLNEAFPEPEEGMDR